jgi:tetratricopeptide (TPR) repeat protein
MMQTLFLSAVSSEFSMLRRRLANLCQRTKKCQVRHQDDFFHRGVKTLQKLVEEVQESTLVIHLIGAQSGWCIPVDQANAFLDDQKHRDFQLRFPDVAHQAREGNLPATQWEAWLGLYFGKRLISFQLKTADMDDLQKMHVERLNTIEEHPDKVDDLEEMVVEIVGSLITLGLFTAEDVRRPIHLPYASIGALFKGRDEFMEQLRTSLRSSTDHRATAITGKAVHGLGGVGKTRLAVEYAWQHADEFSAVLCVTADSPENLDRNLAELTGPMVLDLAEHSATEQEVRVAAALRWLQSHPGWFLILDNVDTEEAVDAVEKLLARLRGGQVLITSRLARFSDVVESLELDVLSPEDGAVFLLEKTQPKNRRGRKLSETDQTDALELAKELDGLALAMEQAGAYIVQLRCSFAEYLTLWRSHKAEVQQWLNRTIQYAGPTNAPLRSVAVTWQTTIEQLGELERRLLDLLAWFAPEPVPLSIFARLTELSQWDTDGFDPAISNLADFSMLTWDADLGTVKVHRVVQEILRTRQADPKANLNLALRFLQRSIPEGDPADVRTWPAWESLRLHVDSATQHGKRLDIPVPTSFLMGQLGTLLSARALHREAELLKRDALAIDELHFGPDSPEVAVRLNNLAQTLQDTNRLSEAEPLIRRALAIDEQSYGADHPMVARDLNNLAQLLQATNRLSEAEPLMRRALAIDEQSCGPDHPMVAIRLNNLALLLKATNRLSEAEPLMRRALAIDEQSYGPDHPNVATALNNLALLLKATNRLSEAEPLMARVVTIFENSYGKEHPNVATALNNLALLLKATNRLSEAEPLMARVVTIDEQSYGPDHPDVARDLNNLAQLLKATNRLSEAEPLMRQALAIDEQSYGPDHPDVARDLNNLAQLLKATNRLSEAEPLSWRMVSIFVGFGKATGHEHPHMQAALQNYFSILTDMGMSEQEAISKIQAKMRGDNP